VVLALGQLLVQLVITESQVGQISAGVHTLNFAIWLGSSILLLALASLFNPASNLDLAHEQHYS
jgi:hypothetical protein